MLGTDEGRCGVFEGSAVKSVVLPSTLRRIEYHAFQGCEKLEDIILPERLEFIGKYCFYQSGLESVEFPASLRTVSQGAFAECESLMTAKFNEGLEVLGEGDDEDVGVFYESAVENVQLPSTLRRIEYTTFTHCENLQSIELPDALEYIG